MEMGAIKKYYPQPEACFKSFMAGSDIILICHTKELQLQTINYFKDRYVHGELCEQRLNDALERIFRMKSRYENFRVESDAGAPDYKKNAGFAQNLADSSLTLVSDPNQILAKIHSGDLKFKKMNKIFIIEAEFEAITQVEDTNSDSALPLLIKKEFAFSKVEIIHEKFGVKIEPIKSVALYKKLEELGLKEAFVILLTYNAHIFQGQRELASLISQNAAYTIAAAVRNPYDLMCVSEKACKLATYGFRRSNMLSLYKTIFQGMKPSGILPVELKCNNS